MTGPLRGPARSAARRQLALIAVVQVLAMATWFSASAVVPSLMQEWDLGRTAAGLLTVAVQVGFVAGAVGSALFNLPDIVPAHRLVAVAALVAAAIVLTWLPGRRGGVASVTD